MSRLQITWKAARVNAGLTQEDVARLIKVSPVTIINWERGKTEIKEPSKMALAQLYGVEIDDIKKEVAC